MLALLCLVRILKDLRNGSVETCNHYRAKIKLTPGQTTWIWRQTSDLVLSQAAFQTLSATYLRAGVRRGGGAKENFGDHQGKFN